LKSLFSPFLIAVALVAAIPLQAAAQERKTLIRVTVDASDVPVTLEIVKDGALRPSKLEPIQGQPRTFGIDLGDPFATAGSNVLTIPYIVAARWGALGSEELFLEIRRSVTQAVDADILNVRSAGTRQEIEQIERLSKSNYSDQLRRFFWARAHHRNMRSVQKLPNHKNALRSAKEWFDASYWLSSREQSYFRMDPEVVRIMSDYAEQAQRDADFRKTMISVVKPGYIEGMLKEVSTTRYQLVAAVADAAKRGDIKTAQDLNTALLGDIQKLADAEREQVRVSRGVTIEILRKNDTFLDSRAKARGL
jgi:hypothetical protein